MSNDTDRTTYTVIAKRWKRGWELHIDGVGVTQSKTLNDAEAMVRDYIHLDTGAAPDSFAVEITPEISRDLDKATRDARRAVAEADEVQRAAAASSREVARRLKSVGLSGREIAVVLHVSPQRVSQLLRRVDPPPFAVSAKGATRRASAAMRAVGRSRDRVHG